MTKNRNFVARFDVLTVLFLTTEVVSGHRVVGWAARYDAFILKKLHNPRKQLFFLDCLTFQDEGTTIFRNVGNHKPNYTASHFRRPQFLESFQDAQEFKHKWTCNYTQVAGERIQLQNFVTTVTNIGVSYTRGNPVNRWRQTLQCVGRGGVWNRLSSGTQSCLHSFVSSGEGAEEPSWTVRLPRRTAKPQGKSNVFAGYETINWLWQEYTD